MITEDSLSVTSIYVSHNSDEYIKKFSNKHINELGDKVFLVNSSMNDIEVDCFSGFEVINIGKNVGFSVANNIAVNASIDDSTDYYMFINPDVYLPPEWKKKISLFLCDQKYSDIGIFTVPLLGYDFARDMPTGLIDSLGIYKTWFGKWYDYLAGMPVSLFVKDASPFPVPSACGALMIVRRSVVQSLLLKNGYVFNESYFMYKEDIELSIRVRRLGKEVLMVPSIPAYHCRGWDGSRNSPYWKRLLSAKNELSMHLKYYWRFVPYSALKYFYVKYLERKTFTS